ncbi:MAG: biotin synthase BioB [Sporomusaceae bacterium]|nr:biotin synthase BioB [Sporomusaceae bacterium]
MSLKFLSDLGEKVLSGGSITFDEALALTEIADNEIPVLLGIANKIRDEFTGKAVDTCQIVNARSGNCSEDCKFCAQSAHHREVKLPVYSLMSEDDILAAAKKAEEEGAYRFCIVTAGCGMERDPEFPKIISAIERIGRETALNRCCSLGTLDETNVQELKAAGITRYHHNLETSRSYFDHICTTHTYDDRIATIKRVKSAGLQACSGCIIGMGETWRQRLELAFELKELDVDSIPVNVLNAIRGTALQHQPRLSPMEILQTFAIFRFILPGKIIRYAGGREHNLGALSPLGFIAGINGMLMGNYLTTEGRPAAEELKTVRGLGLEPLQV